MELKKFLEETLLQINEGVKFSEPVIIQPM